MNRPALQALRDTLRQAGSPTVSPITLCHLLDALLAADPPGGDAGLADLRAESKRQWEATQRHRVARPAALWETV